MRTILTLAASTLLAMPGIAQAAEPACLTKGEFSALAAYAMPSVIEGSTKRCSPSLGPDAYLTKNGTPLAKRYAARKDASWPQAKTAFFKFSQKKGDKSAEFMRQLPDDSLKQIVDTVLEGMTSQEIPLEDCGTIDEFARLIAPLPAQNTAELLTLLVGLTSKPGTGAMGKLAICKA
ncbi:MAG: hypothetical protein R3D99_00210 [Altererythrobacter sp.]|jgi:hypothetical protein